MKRRSPVVALVAAVAAAAGVALVGGRRRARAADLKAYHTASYGTGRSQTTKMTWPASDPVAVASFMLGYLPTTPWLVGNETWVDGGCATWGKVIVGNHTDSAFQLHAVAAPARPDGGREVASAERAFHAAAQAALAADDGAGGSRAALETHAAFYADDLDAYAARFACGGVNFRSIRWPTADGTWMAEA